MEAMCHTPRKRKSKSLDKGCSVERERKRKKMIKEGKVKRGIGRKNITFFLVLHA